MTIELLSEHACFGGVQGFYRTSSVACGGPMRFAVFQPPQAAAGRVPVLFYLAGLTCTEETATMKAGAQRVAAELGLMLVMPDTSPRDTGFEGATGDWEFGEGAGFYLDATQAPWSSRFRMESHVVHELPAVVRPGLPILLAEGRMRLEVISVDRQDVHCRVVRGGVLKKRGLNLPECDLPVPALSARDRQDLGFLLEEDVDMVALSFVRTADDVITLKEILNRAHSALRVIAKIEKPEAVDNFEEILAVTDGVMVARGDLGVEVNPERVPLIQKQIIRLCNRAGKPVITATQMLESMIGSPRPTRAETSDVANAILDGTDAVMLSAETASGRYPCEAVAMMVRIAHDVEADPHLKELFYHPLPLERGYTSLPEAIGQAACHVATAVGAAAILAFTQTGSTAALVAKYRPQMPVYAVTPSQVVRRRMALYAGVRSIRVDIEGDTEAQIRSVEAAVLKSGVLKKGDVVVITMGSPVSDPGTTNLLKIHRLGTGPYFEVH